MPGLGFISTSEANDPTLNSYYGAQPTAAAPNWGTTPGAGSPGGITAFLQQHQAAIIAGAAALLLLAIVAKRRD